MKICIRQKMDLLSRLLLSALVLLSALIPNQFALAQLQDCGPHVYSPCVEHDNQHIVASHVKMSAESKSSFSDQDSALPHDRAHQVEQKELLHFGMSTTGIQFAFITTIPRVRIQRETPHTVPLKLFRSFLKPPGNFPALSALKTIRLLV